MRRALGVWPGPPIWDAARGRALIFYGLIYGEPGPFNFRGVGESIAVWRDFDALERAAWQVWDGAGFSGDVGKAKPLFDGAPIMSVHHAPALGRYLAVYAAPVSRDVELRTAPALSGPWSAPLRLFVTDPGAGEWTYDAVAHAALAEDDGRVLYVTYSRPTGETWFSARFPLVRVELR